jgi:predicted unusual protein kinase regulating ubiquinone biosynthesis (AarF/ABC1/UbiB family)
MTEIMRSFYAFPFELPQNLVYIFKTVTLLEGIGTAYDPSYNLVKDMVPVAKKYIKETPLGESMSPVNLIKNAFNQVKELINDAGRLIRTAYAEEFKVKIHPTNVSNLENFLIHIMKRLIASIVGGFIGTISALVFIEDKNVYLLIAGLSVAALIVFISLSLPIKTTYGYSTILDIFRHKNDD